MKGRVPNRRRIFLVDAQIQGRFIIFLIFFLIGYNLLATLLQKLALQMELPVFVLIYLAAMALYVGLAGIFFSHRLAGPLHKINEVLGDISRGDLFINIHCRRENDRVVTEIASRVNETVDGFRESMRTVESAASEISRDVEGIRDKIWCRRLEFPEVAHHLEALRERGKTLDDVVRRYQVR